MRESFESTLPEWVGDALREPVTSGAAARARIMDSIRQQPAPRSYIAPMRPSRWLRRGLLTPVGSVVGSLVLTVAVMMRLGTGLHRSDDITTMTRFLGDSVVPSLAATRGELSLSDAPRQWLDTMRVVEFVLRGSSVHAAAIIGDFNRWKRGATPLVPEGRHTWRARVLVPRDVLTMAYLVNGEQIIRVNAEQQ